MCFSILPIKNNHNKLDKSTNQPALSKMFKEVSVCFMREVPNLLKVNIPANFLAYSTNKCQVLLPKQLLF